MTKATLFGLTGFLVMSVGSSMPVHGDMAAMKAACSADVQKYCSEVKPGGGRIAACLADNGSSLSTGCQSAIGESKQNLKAGMKDFEAACGADMQKFCADVKPGEGRRISCLASHQNDVSDACKQEMASAKNKMHARSVNSPMGAPNGTPPAAPADEPAQ